MGETDEQGGEWKPGPREGPRRFISALLRWPKRRLSNPDTALVQGQPRASAITCELVHGSVQSIRNYRSTSQCCHATSSQRARMRGRNKLTMDDA